ncbi:MAG: adenosylcobinamide-GDP ribazoletransferase [Deltaproteobacteria bacterium]|nr:adenosylcobinamide-GDP ribazoletransferase [Deltaproteobacteria bacterium]
MFRAVATAFAFLTRLPVSVRAVTDRDLGRSVAFFPLVGLVLGLAAAGLAYALAGHLPSLIIAVIVVTTLAGLTGGLHLDGLADLVDGLGGGRGNRERTLEIMRDSRIGAHGATALVLLLMAKVAGVMAALDAGDFAGLLAFPVVARWAVAPQIVWFPYARREQDGLGRAFTSEAGGVQLLIATVIVLALALALVVAMGNAIPMATGAGVALAVSLLIAFGVRARLAGLTGDVYGATIEICETAALFAAALR